MTNRERAIELFKDNKGAYHISLVTGMPIKEVYHYLRESEELNKRHRDAIAKKREEDACFQ